MHLLYLEIQGVRQLFEVVLHLVAQRPFSPPISAGRYPCPDENVGKQFSALRAISENTLALSAKMAPLAPRLVYLKDPLQK